MRGEVAWFHPTWRSSCHIVPLNGLCNGAELDELLQRSSTMTRRGKVLWLLVMLGGMWALTNLSACNTVEGMGEDVEDAGEGVQGAAQGADDAN